MKRLGIVFLVALFGAGLCYGQTSSAAPGQPAAASHGAFPVRITKTLDSSKLKAGDAVDVETGGSFKLADGMLVPKGSKLVGHVTSAKSRAKGDQNSELTIAFDRLNVASGKQFSVKGVVQAVFPPAPEQDPGMPFSTASKGGAPMAGEGGGAPAMSTMPTPGYQPTQTPSGSNPQARGNVDPTVDPKSVGAHDMGDISLEDGVLRSKGKNLKLGNGVRLIVHVDIFEQVGT